MTERPQSFLYILSTPTAMGSSPSTNNRTGPNYCKNSLKSSSKQPFFTQKLPMTPTDTAFISCTMAHHSVFTMLTQQERQSCLEHFEKWRYGKGSFVYRQYNPSDYLYLVLQGNLSMEIDCCVVGGYEEGEYFGQQSVCYGCPYSSTIRVSSYSCVLLALHRRVLLPVVQTAMLRYQEEINTLMNHIQFFNYLTTKERREFIKNTYLLHLKPKETLFEQNEESYTFYIIKKGRISIEIEGKAVVEIKQRDNFGQSAFLGLYKNGDKNRRKGRAVAKNEVQVYSVSLYCLRGALSNSIRFIVFHNKQKWALLRDSNLKSIHRVDHNHLLQLFSIQQAGHYTVLARKGSQPDKLFVPVEGHINSTEQLKLYNSEFLLQKNWESTLPNDIMLTSGGFYAYASIQEVKNLLFIDNESFLGKDLNLKMKKQPLFINMSYSMRHLNSSVMLLDSSPSCSVILGTDRKSGNQIIVKKYRKKTEQCAFSIQCIEPQLKKQPTLLQSLNTIPLKSMRSTNMKVSHCMFPSILAMEGGKQSLTVSSVNTTDKPGVDESLVERQREVLAGLSHGRVGGFYRSEQDSQNYYLFLQFMRGNSLSNIICSMSCLPHKMTRYYLASLATTLHYLHSQSIIYRNINSKNVIIKHDGQVVLIDMSCAKQLTKDNHFKTNTMTGVSHYMAPEVIMRREYGVEADVWGLGVLLFEMMTGTVPFGHGESDPLKVYQAIRKERYPKYMIRDRNAVQLLDRLLERDPNKRMGDLMKVRECAFMSDLEFKWDEFLNGTLTPQYCPPRTELDYTTIESEGFYDASTLREWS